MTGTPAATRILIVEDEFLIRLTLAEALADEGFEVLEADTGDAALALLTPDCGIGLLLTDIQLPGSIDGNTLAARAREHFPDLPVIFTTGDPSTGRPTSPRDLFVAKPYSLAEICMAARRLTP